MTHNTEVKLLRERKRDRLTASGKRETDDHVSEKKYGEKPFKKITRTKS